MLPTVHDQIYDVKIYCYEISDVDCDLQYHPIICDPSTLHIQRDKTFFFAHGNLYKI